MSQKEVKKLEAKNMTKKDFLFEFAPIKFTSPTNDIFRATLKSSVDGVVLWLESKKTKDQWQTTVSDISSCGPAGVPGDAVIQFLKRAFELIVVTDSIYIADRDDPVLEMHQNDGEISLVLTLSIMNGIWRPEFIFSLLPVGLDKIDVLEAKLRDAQEEIAELKMMNHVKETIYLALSSQTACANSQMVVWDGNSPRSIPEDFFILSKDNRKITIRKEGTYQIYVRLAGTNSGNTQSLGLQINKEEVAQCTQSDANGHQNTAQLTEILLMKVGDVLQVRCGCNSNSLTVPAANRFHILYLGNK